MLNGMKEKKGKRVAIVKFAVLKVMLLKIAQY